MECVLPHIWADAHASKEVGRSNFFYYVYATVPGREYVDVTSVVDSETATLAWLVGALEHARTRGRTKLVGYLKAVVEDVVFEMEAAARRHEYR